MQVEYAKELLNRYPNVVSTEGGTAVLTHCLYPSNQAVTVFVSGGSNGLRVNDGGGALDVLSAHGCNVASPDRFLMRFCRRKGLRADRGKIYTPIVPPEGLLAAVIMVANASAEAAHWGIEHLKPAARPHDLRKELRNLLTHRFSKERVQSDERLTGKSNRQYHFDLVVTLKGNHRLVVDAVLPDASSINSRAIANMDLGRLDDPNIIQRIVYDDEQDWDAADLNLLQMAATLVPYSRFERSLSNLKEVN